MASFGWALIQLLWQGVLLAALFAFALWILRAASSSARYGLGALALVALVALPLLSLRAFDAGYSVAGWSCSIGSVTGLAGRIEPHLGGLAAFWALGASFGLLRLVGGVCLTRRYAAESGPLPDALRRDAEALAEQMGVRRVRFGLSGRLESPATVGCLDPLVLLPACAIAVLPEGELRAVLAHELAHVRRRDALANLIQSWIESILFFHPAVWWISSCVRMEREHCCDDLATAAVADGRALARALARLECHAPPPSLAVAGTGGLLVARVRRLLGGVGRAWAPIGPGLRAALLLAALLGATMAPAEPPCPTLAENTAREEEDESAIVRLKVLVLRLRLPAQDPVGELPIGFDPWPNVIRVARWMLQPGGIV